MAFICVIMVSIMFSTPVLAASEKRNDSWMKKGVEFGKDIYNEYGENLGKAKDVAETVYDIYDTGKKLYDARDMDERVDVLIDVTKDYGKTVAKTAMKTAVNSVITTSATSTAVTVAGAVGMTAKTGTAIASLSGVAATNATLCAIGTPVASTFTAVTGVACAPAVVGGAIIAGGAALLCWGVSECIDWIWD